MATVPKRKYISKKRWSLHWWCYYRKWRSRWKWACRWNGQSIVNRTAKETKVLKSLWSNWRRQISGFICPTKTFLQVHKRQKNPVKIKWQTVPREPALQPRGAENIMKNRPGPPGLAKRVKTSLQLFKLFFTDGMLGKIVLYTNNSIEPAMEWFSTLLAERDKYLHFQKVDKVDISAFIGLLYIRAAFRINMRDTREISTLQSSNDVFSATMSCNRFQFICKFIKFDGKPTRNDLWKSNKYGCLRELFEMMNEQNVKCRFPSPLFAAV